MLPEMITYYSQQNPEHDIERIKDFLLRDNSRQFKEQTDQNGTIYDFEVESLNRKTAWDNVIVYELKTKITVTQGGEDQYTKDNVLGISEDRGKNWKFIKNDPEMLKPILLLTYTEEEVNKILM